MLTASIRAFVEDKRHEIAELFRQGDASFVAVALWIVAEFFGEVRPFQANNLCLAHGLYDLCADLECELV